MRNSLAKNAAFFVSQRFTSEDQNGLDVIENVRWAHRDIILDVNQC